MNTYQRNEDLSVPQSGVNLSPIMRQVYMWMGLGTLITAFMAYFTVSTPLRLLAANPIILMVAMLAEFGLVMGISLGLSRISSGVAIALFILYAALNGFTLSMILLVYTNGSVIAAFVSTSALFGAMTILGYTTKMDLTKMGTYLIMGVFGLLIAMVVNMFMNSGPLNMIISMAGVLIFTGLTAYDTQRIGRMAAQMSGQGSEATSKMAIMGALKLYLDFINMFLFMLRLFGRRR
jgi:FtsH-binding integral membrane protein